MGRKRSDRTLLTGANVAAGDFYTINDISEAAAADQNKRIVHSELQIAIGSGLVLDLPQINDTSDDHQYVFAVNELTADRTVTLPLLTGDDEFVFKDHTVTMTNKTLTSPTINTGMTGNFINGATDKAIPITADELLIGDTADSNNIKKADIASVVNLADHDVLTNFVANKHINHTSVTLIAGDGISGGGDISANRSFALDINGMANTGTSCGDSDLFAYYDATTDTRMEKITFSNLRYEITKGWNNIITESGTSRTLALTDAGKYIRCTNAAAVTVTVPPNSSVAFPVGTELEIYQAGAGTVTLAEGSGVTINKASTLGSVGQYYSFTIKKVNTDVWDSAGGLA